MDTKQASCFQLPSWHLSYSYPTEYFTIFNIKEEKRENSFFSPSSCKVSEPCYWQVLPTQRAQYFSAEQHFALHQPRRWSKDSDCAGIRHAALSTLPLSTSATHKPLSSWSHTPRQAGGRALIPPCKNPHEVLNEMRLQSHLHRFLRISQSETEFSLPSWSAKPIPSHIWPQWSNWFDLTPINYNLPQRTKATNALFFFSVF